jgi:hypothetical protein
VELEDEVQNDLKRATGEITKESEGIRKLNRVLQLTGFSDPVYAEAYVTVHQVGFGRAGERVCPVVVCRGRHRVADFAVMEARLYGWRRLHMLSMLQDRAFEI